MGVTYKLKPEIVNFILAEKTANPTLGCRALAKIIDERFQLIVSKSSISNVLKDAQLSSSVGRRSTIETPEPKEKKIAKFRIPKEKKEKIFPIKNSSDISSPPAAAPVEKKVIPSETTYAQLIPERKTRENSIREVGDAPAHVKPSEPPKEDMGIFILKAAIWDMGREAILDSIIQRVPEFPQNDSKLVNWLLFAPLMAEGVPSAESITTNRQRTSIVDSEVNREDQFRMLQFLEKESRRFTLSTVTELNQIFAEASEVMVEFQNGHNYRLGPLLNQFDNGQPFGSRPLNNTMDVVSKELISNVHTGIFSLNWTKFEDILNFVRSLQGAKGQKLTKVNVHDGSGGVISEFHNPLDKERAFALRIPYMAEIRELCKGDLIFAAETYKMNLQKFNIAQTQLNVHPPLGAAFFKEKHQSLPEFVCLFNASPDDYLIKKCLIRFMRMDERVLPKPGQAERRLQDLKNMLARNIWPSWVETVEVVLTRLSEYCQKYLLPSFYQTWDFSSMKRYLFQLPGYYEKRGQTLSIRLMPSEDYLYLEQLSLALERINQLEIRDKDGNLVEFGIA